MKTGRYLFFASFALSCCLPACVFQTSVLGQSPPPQAKVNSTSDQDELNVHRTAAETYQISGDLENARVENRMIVAIALRRLANAAIREGQLKRASEILTESIAASENIEARTTLALVYMQIGDLDQGVTQAQASVALDPKNGEAQDVLGKLLYQKGDYAAALPILERTLSLKPDFDAAYTLGMTYLQLKQLDRAKLLFEEMLNGVTKKASLHIILGRAFEETNYPLEAEREFKAAIKTDPKIPGAHFYLGYTILQHGGSQRLTESGSEFDQELKLSPQDPFSHFFAGVVGSSLGDHPKAIGFLQEAIRLKPDLGPAYLFLGQSQVELGQDASAEKSLRKAIELNDDPSKNAYQIRRAYVMLGRLLNKMGRNAEGEQVLAKARELQGQLVESAREEIRKTLGDVLTSAKPSAPVSADAAKSTGNAPALSAQESAALKQVKDQLSQIAAQAYHNLAVIETQNGQYDESLADFAAAARWKADFPGLDRNWGIVSFRASQYDKAIAPLSRHLKVHPDDALARRMLGVSYYFTKNSKQAVETLKPIESSLTSDPELAYFYGISLVQLQRHPEAGVIFGRIADQNPTSAQAHFYAGQGFVLTGGYERAVKEFRQAAAIDPKMAAAHYNAGQSLIRMNRLDEAEKEFRQELRLNPTDESSKYHLAYTLLERKSGNDEAMNLLREAIASKYDYADARYQLGKALIEKGDINEAISQLEVAANIEPKKDYIHYQLSIAYRKAERADDAERELKLYRELKAENRSEKPAGMGSKKDVP